MNPKILIDELEIDIVEEDDEKALEELLDDSISWKQILKAVIAIILVGTAMYYSIIGVFPSDLFVYILLIVCVIAGVLLISFEREEEDSRQTVSCVKCSKCDFQSINSYEDGDYLFKVKGKCKNCYESLSIIEIYSVKLAE
jgi:hypothetical protein